MGTILASAIATNVRSVIGDDSAVRLTDPKALSFLNDGQREVVTYLPQANMATEVLQPVAGTRQTLVGMGATRGMQVMELTRNYASDGTTVGAAIRVLKAGRKWLDENRPTWHTDAASGVIRHYATDEDDPLTVWVWPPHSGVGKVEAIYSQLPAAIAAIGNAISLEDRYANALEHYLLARVYGFNQPGTLSQSLGQGHYAIFLQLLGVKDKRMAEQDRSKDEAAQ